MHRFLVILTAVLLIGDSDIFAARSSSSFRSSSSSRSRSSSSSFRPASKPKVAPTNPRPASSFKSTQSAQPAQVSQTNRATTVTQTKTVTKTKIDSKLAKKNAEAAKMYGSRSKAQEAFKSKIKNDPSFSTRYTNKFDREPASRPEYIPASVSRGGTNYTVIYNEGSYGYWNTVNGISTWIMLDMMTDMIVTDAMLSSHGYGSYTPVGAPVPYRSNNTGIIVLSVVGGLVVIGGLVYIIRAVI